jgi:hypothetical protein
MTLQPWSFDLQYRLYYVSFLLNFPQREMSSSEVPYRSIPCVQFSFMFIPFCFYFGLKSDTILCNYLKNKVEKKSFNQLVACKCHLLTLLFLTLYFCFASLFGVLWL